MKHSLFLKLFNFLLLGVIAVFTPRAFSGVFNLPHFVKPGEFGIAVEPEFILSNGSGVGINLRYIHGLSEDTNFTGILGTGNGPRFFRAGGFFSWDLFPDINNQPGVGFAAGALFVQLNSTGTAEITGVPYIHKTFFTQKGKIEPFFAFPFGLSLSNSTYKYLSSLSFGSFFHLNEHFSNVVELGVALNNTNTYISGGIIYYH